MDFLKYHESGKIKITSKVKVDHSNLHIYYTPGVAEPCMMISNIESEVYKYTWKSNSIAVISDGSRILGLGNIGPSAAMPLLEGKALLFNSYAGLDAVPIAISQLSVDETVKLVKSISHGFGGINLEDISTPRCYSILDRLINELNIPVFHDDQQGTAIVILASLFNALKIVNKNIQNVKIVLYGSGSANTAVYRLLKLSGVNPEKQISMFNSHGALGADRKELFEVPILKEICENVKSTSLEAAFKDADVLIALSASGPNTIDSELIKLMNKDAIVFVCANPVPEIDPITLKLMGVKVVATGRSDYPNQANNALIFPGLFRGVMDAMSSKVTWTMCIEVAKAVAKLAEEDGLNENYIIPNIDHPKLHYTVANSAALASIKEGFNRTANIDEIFEKIKKNLNK